MVKFHQEGTIHNRYQQSFPVVLDLDAADDGHLSGFVNFHGNVRPDGFPVGDKFSIITDDPRAGIVRECGDGNVGECGDRRDVPRVFSQKEKENKCNVPSVCPRSFPVFYASAAHPRFSERTRVALRSDLAHKNHQNSNFLFRLR